MIKLVGETERKGKERMGTIHHLFWWVTKSRDMNRKTRTRRKKNGSRRKKQDETLKMIG